MHAVRSDARSTATLAGELAARASTGALDLPLLPDVAMRVINACSDPNSDLRRVAEVVRHDPAMAAHVLRVANSPMYAPRTPIVSLQQALARVGLAGLKQIALLVTCQARVFVAPGFEAPVAEALRHSIAVAFFAQEIARSRRANVEEAFLTGLLHDVGRPVLLQASADIARAWGASFAIEEVAAAVDASHAAAGGALAAAWKLSERVADAIRQHHAEAPALEDSSVWTLVLADALAKHALDPTAMPGDRIRAHRAAAPLEIYPDALDALLLLRDRAVAAVETLAS